MTDLFVSRITDTLANVQQRIAGVEEESGAFERASYENSRTVAKWTKATVEREMEFSETYATVVEELNGRS